MELKLRLNPRQALNKAFLKVKPHRDEIDKFKKNLIDLLDRISDAEKNAESEEFHKNLMRDFLKETYYGQSHFINTKGRADLVIHNGSTGQSPVGIIIEAKRPANKAEMVTTENLNAKAFQELLLYYLRERITHKNLEIKHLVITNINEWFIFDATVFEGLFAQDKELVKQFKKFEDKQLSGTKTEVFYKEIAKPFIADILSHKEIVFTHFNIQGYQKALRNADKTDDRKLIELFKLLSPEHLLKLPFANDSNTLDKRFYTELLHIIGLTEIKEKSKKLIKRNKEGERNAGTLLEEAIAQLDSLDKLPRLRKLGRFGDTDEKILFNAALELSITWINRILFLKLLEAQMLTYHKGDKSYSFLNHERIKGYDDLNRLFFQVLARKHDDRKGEAKTAFEKVPYLNSSLFELTDLEQELVISNLSDRETIPIISTTVLKDQQGKKRTGDINTLEYLFAFLDAYDFSSEGSEEIQEENKTLINASVLGLIFEKINGYKDGSFFTPGFITMYMCRETIRKAVVQKFNEAKGWKCKNIDELKEEIETKYPEVRKEANGIINRIRICDPAVGSGHFLVSALNEIIAIKSDLEILQYRDGKRMKNYDVRVENDELVVTDDGGELFQYNPKNSQSQRAQEALFHEKQTIIENCLFGVDINPNSVAICRLRLWIELLKSAYYKAGATELETLPNIDINIKCGNSLVSRFAIDAKMGKALKKKKWKVCDYQKAVADYRNATNKDEKRKLNDLIESIKSDFSREIASNDPKEIKLDRQKQRWSTVAAEGLFERSEQEQAAREKELAKLNKEIPKLEAEIEEIKANKIFANAFEWRFEFPEVLNDKGRFVGFDVVIGNPPYIPLESFEINERKFFNSKYAQLERKYETSVPFIIEGLNILDNDGFLAYIAPLTWQTGENYSKFRNYFFENFGLDKLINLPFNIFEDAYVDTALYFISKERRPEYSIYSFKKKAKVKSLENLDYDIFKVSEIQSPAYKVILNKTVQQFSRFESESFVPLGEITKSTQGLSGSNFPKANDNSTDCVFPYLAQGNVYNYRLIKRDVYNTNLSDKENLMQFYQAEPKILIRRVINRQDRLSVTYCSEKLVFKKDINPFIPIDDRFDCHFLTGILASKLISFIYLNSSSIATKDDFRQTTLTELRKLPIPNVSANEQVEICKLVKNVLKIKEKHPSADTSILEAQIDQLVYQLYGLTQDEIAIIENAAS